MNTVIHEDIASYAKNCHMTFDRVVDVVYDTMPELCINPDLSKEENVLAYWRIYKIIYKSNDEIK